MARNTEVIARNNEVMDRFEGTMDRLREELRRQAEAFANDRAVMRDFIADRRALDERMDRRSQAITGAMIDLAAEIRSWRAEGGPGPPV